MEAPERFVAWLSAHEHHDRLYGWVYRYHSRSDAHSVALCRLVLEDFLEASEMLRDHAMADKIVYGITVVNIASTFVSPLRQKGGELHVSKHNQPHAAQKMVNHLRGLPIRDSVEGRGFDAHATIVVDCDNQGPAFPWTAPPAPQPGDRDHYVSFVARIAEAYSARFGW